jgi:hypothetical protein
LNETAIQKGNINTNNKTSEESSQKAAGLQVTQMMSEENSNEMHWTLMGIDPDLFEITKNIIGIYQHTEDLSNEYYEKIK